MDKKIRSLVCVVLVGLVGAESFLGIAYGSLSDALIEKSSLKPSREPIVLENGRVLVSSFESFSVKGKIKASSCSYIARKNLELIATQVGEDPEDIAQGDAEYLLKKGIYYDLLSPYKKDDFIAGLDDRLSSNHETVFDAYRYVGSRPEGVRGHRAVIFRGEDEQWYILDPIDGKKIRKPQLLSAYLDDDVDRAIWYIRIPGIDIPRQKVETNYLEYAMEYLSPELQLFLQTHYFGIPQVVSDRVLGLFSRASAMRRSRSSE